MPPITHGRLRDFADDPIGVMQRLRAEHGDLCALQEENQQLVFAYGPANNQLVLSDPARFHSRFFVVRGPRNSAHRRLSSGLLTMNGEEHRSNRRLIMESFQKRGLGLYHDTIAGLTREMLDTWRPGDVIDVNREMLQFMLRLTSAILFGLDVPELSYRIGAKIDDWVHDNHAAGMGVFVSSPDLGEHYERMLARAEDLERDLLELIELRRHGRPGATDLLSLLLRAYEEDSAITDEQLSGHVALLFGAAHLTTAHTLTWTLLLLAQHPEAAAECFAEATTAFEGDLPDADLPNRCPSMERVVKESMRLLPASAYVQRMCAEPVDLGPFRLERGTPVIWSQYVTHHMEEVFPGANRFDPDRWRTIKPSPYEYLPFGAGPRMCVGGPLAMRILQTVLPMIAKRFRLECVPGTSVDPRVVSTTFGPAAGLPMEVHRASGRFELIPVSGGIHDCVDLPQPTTLRHAA